jgi:pyruvate,orthophosphate dikinase
VPEPLPAGPEDRRHYQPPARDLPGASVLGIKRFSYTQYLDIFRGLSDGVKDVIYAYYTNIHENNLSIIIPQVGAANLLTKYRGLWDEQDAGGSILRMSEFFFRNLIAGTFGLQHLDSFITRIMQTLDRQKELLDGESLDLLMTYNPENAISFLHKSNPQTKNLIHLGNKGLNLTQLLSAGKPVPPGFIITTEIFRCWPVVNKFQKARDEFMRQVRQSLSELEALSGRQFGYSQNPLLLSVRSGASISMPGMMATIHNVGLNQEIVEEFARATVGHGRGNEAGAVPDPHEQRQGPLRRQGQKRIPAGCDEGAGPGILCGCARRGHYHSR